MGKGEFSSSILSRLDLDDVEEIVWEPYHKDGPGRPPRNPSGIFKALIVKRLRHISSDRDLREICDIEDEGRPYHPSQLTRFRKRVGPERLERIMNGMIEELVEGGVIKGETVVLDATFIKASRMREQLDLNRHGVGGLRNIIVHVLLCIIAMLLTAVAALRLNRPEKVRSITLLGW